MLLHIYFIPLCHKKHNEGLEHKGVTEQNKWPDMLETLSYITCASNGKLYEATCAPPPDDGQTEESGQVV